MKTSHFLAVLFNLLCLAFSSNVALAQRLEKHAIGNSGMEYYANCTIPFEKSYSEDSSEIHSGECKYESFTYGIISVKLYEATQNPNLAEEIAVAYTDFLKSEVFNIKKSMEYGKGHTLKSNDKVKGFINYWEDEAKDKWKIKTWTDGRYIVFMYVYGATESNPTRTDLFFDSIRFPK